MEKMTRRTFLKRGFGILGAALAMACGGYGYARYIEPRMIEITRHTITSRLIPAALTILKSFNSAIRISVMCLHPVT